ncbi:MAG: DUF4160 domain-containing protein [Prevotellaceae bacterium]|jgi:hypothetical protein|nr:DUF4160 domain-containing protein [Prevotellaceae bacterium]
MPQVYRYFGLIFYFWSNDHLPAHIHVTDATRERECVFDLILENSILIETRMRIDIKPSLKSEEITSAKAFISVFYPQIIKKWFEFYVCGKEIKPITIRKKITGEIEIGETIKHLEALQKQFYPARKTKKNGKK